MNLDHMVLNGWKAFDFSSGNYEAWRGMAGNWINENYSNYNLELSALSCSQPYTTGSFDLACYWVASPATYDILQSNVVGAPAPPLVDLGEMADSSSTSSTEGDDGSEGDTSNGMNPLGFLNVKLPIKGFPWAIPMWALLFLLILVRSTKKK